VELSPGCCGAMELEAADVEGGPEVNLLPGRAR
jgi:hypothetical protein